MSLINQLPDSRRGNKLPRQSPAHPGQDKLAAEPPPKGWSHLGQMSGTSQGGEVTCPVGENQPILVWGLKVGLHRK